jgi:CubicO group peptidase (beta-lactamase class C family)
MTRTPTILGFLVLIAFARPASAQDSSLIGLWGGETANRPRIHGELLLERRGDEWTARVAGFEAVGVAARDSLAIAFPAGQGTLRAFDLGRESGPRAYWVQPAGDGPAYATPIRLVAAGPDAWRGHVEPLEPRFSLYLAIAADGDSLRGVFRNPDFNWNGRGSGYRVIQRDGALAFLDRQGVERLVQPYDPERGAITFDFGVPLILTRRTIAEAPGFAPRLAERPYDYQRPPDLGDGWPTAEPETVGLDRDALTRLVRMIAAADPVSDTAPRIHSLLVARHGTLVLDESFRGHAADRLHDLRSASKSFTSVMLGVAMAADSSLTPATALRSVFPGAPLDPTVTVAHLLTHTSGLACDDNDDASPGQEDRMQQESRDWYGYALALPQSHPAGGTYAYCSAGINLVGGVIAAKTGAWLPAYFDRHLARPLEIERYAMNLMPSGQGYAGGGVYLRPRDFLKLGEVFLREGRWKGRQVLPTEWVARSTARQVDVPDGSTDGFGWHRHVLRAGQRDYQTFEANGNGGQFLLVVPQLDLAVVVTAGNYGQYGVWRRIRDEMIPRWVLAAVQP